MHTTIMRGGSWVNYPEDCRSADRNVYYRGNLIGFRVVCQRSIRMGITKDEQIELYRLLSYTTVGQLRELIHTLKRKYPSKYTKIMTSSKLRARMIDRIVSYVMSSQNYSNTIAELGYLRLGVKNINV